MLNWRRGSWTDDWAGPYLGSMRTVFLALLLAIVALPLAASWNVTPSKIELEAGSTFQAHVFFSGLVIMPAHWVFSSDNPAVATAEGEFTYPIDPRPANNGVITIRAISPGVAHVTNGSNAVITVEVLPALPELPVVVVPGIQPQVLAGGRTELHVMAADGEPVTCAWYYGRLGETGSPAAPSQTDSCSYTYVAPNFTGRDFIWVRATSATRSTAVQLQIDLVRRRMRAVAH